jgi:hypothetical protein
MMKKLVIVVGILCSTIQGFALQAQVKQRKEMLLQIAALKVYLEYTQKGYTAVKKGFHFIGDLKKGEFKLHQDYFKSLGKVNPKIKKYAKVAEIVVLQLRIVAIANKTFKGIKQDDLFHGSELDYITRSFERLFEHCDDTLEELITLTTDAKLEMKDDQRLERIDGLYKTMLGNYTFCVAFSEEVKQLAMGKAKEKKDVQWGRVMGGL